MSRKALFPLGLLGLLALLVMACQWLSPQKAKEIVQETAPTVIQQVTQAVGEATPAPSAEATEPLEGRIPGQDEVQSFRSTVQMRLEGALIPQSPLLVFEMDTAWQKPVEHIVIKSGTPPQLTSEMYHTEAGLYMRSAEDEQWTFLGGELGGDVQQLTQTAIMPPTALAIGWPFREGKRSTYEGTPVVHYHWDSSLPDLLNSLSDYWTMAVEDGGSTTEGLEFTPKKVVLDVDVDPQNGWLLHETMEIQGQWKRQGQTAPGKVIWELKITDINQPFTISVPEEIQHPATAANAPLPLPDNAQPEISAGGVRVYLIPGMSTDALIQFWQQAGLKVNTMGAVSGLGSTLLSVTKPDGTEVQVAVQTGEEGLEVMFTSP